MGEVMEDWKVIVREVRRTRMWSKTKLAEELGVSRQTVTSWERNGSTPRTDLALKLLEMSKEVID